jgi:hypothetical protein
MTQAKKPIQKIYTLEQLEKIYASYAECSEALEEGMKEQRAYFKQKKSPKS